MEEIVIRSLQGTASPEELERLGAWRRANPENERSYHEIAGLWEATFRGQRRAPRSDPPSSFEIIRAATMREAASRTRSRNESGSRWTRRIAAAIALLAAGFTGSLVQGPRALMAGSVVTTSAAEMATVTFADGTVVRIGPSSRVRLPAEPSSREVWLEGEAFFSVAAPDDEPFVVHTESGSARALETRFQVEASRAGMRVGVLEGSVEVSAGKLAQEVSGGEVGEIAAGQLSIAPAESPEALRPRLGNFLAFRSTPLSTVVKEVSAHFGMRTEVLDPKTGARTVTASFNDASFTEVMSVICRVTASNCTITDSTAVVVGAGVR